MTKYELKRKKEIYENKLAEINEQLKQYEKVFNCKDIEKPFNKWSLSQQADLFEYSESIFHEFCENPTLTVAKYNVDTINEEKRIKLEK